MATSLGQLFYSLSLDSKDFETKIKALANSVGNIGGKVQIDTSTISKAMADVKTLQDAMAQLSQSVSLNITGMPKTQNIDLVATVGNASDLKTQIESALTGIVVRDVQVDTSTARKAFDAQVWNVRVTTDQSNVRTLVDKIKQVMGINKILVKVTPDWNKAAITKLQNDLQKVIGNIPMKSIKVTVDKKYIQDQLNKMTFTANVDLKVNANQAKSAIASATASTGNLGGGTASNYAAGTNAIHAQNKALTDNLGIRRSINDQMSRNTQLATMLGNAMGNVFATYQIQNFLENLIQIGGEIQKQRLALGHIMNDVNNANMLFEQMKQLAVKSPFGLLDLMQNARQLSAFGVEYNQLYDTMKRLSDMASGLGIQFSRLALAYGETKERGFLDGKLVRQFSYMGLPVLQKIAEYYTQIDKLQNGGVVTAANVRSMVSDKQVSFEDVDAVIKKMTEEGGQFYNMQEVMAESVSGKWKNLKDAIDIMYSDIAEGHSNLLKMPAEILTKFVKNYEILVPVLQAVAARFVGLKIASAISSSALAYNNSALYLNKKAQQELLITSIKRQGTLKMLTAQEKASLATLNQMTIAQFKQLIRTQELSKGDAQRLIAMKRLSAEQEQYLLRTKLLTQAEYQQAIAMRSSRAGITELKIAWMGFKQTISGLFTLTNGLTAVFFAGVAIYDYLSTQSEKAKQYTADMQQATDDFQKATANIASEVHDLDFDSMSMGERDTEIKSMVEYIKDEVPGAAQKLQEIFKTDENGKFVKSNKEIFESLQAIVGQMDILSHTDLKNLTEDAAKAFENYDAISDIEDFQKAQSQLRNMLDGLLNAMSSETRENVFKKFKEDYKEQIAEALNLSNLDDVAKQSNDKIKSLVLANQDLLDKFFATGGMNSSKYINTFKNYIEQYNAVIGSAAKTAQELKQKFESDNKDVDWSSPETVNKWQRVVEETVHVKYKDEPSDAQKILIRVMENPDFLSKLMVKGETTDQMVTRLLGDADLKKNFYLNIIPLYEGKTSQDPWGDIMKGVTGELDTKGTVVGYRDTIKKQLESATTALEEARTLSKFAGKVKKESKTYMKDGRSVVENVWKAITPGDTHVEAYANDLTTYQAAYDKAWTAAYEMGMDANKIVANAKKKFNKKENGTTKQEDTWLKSTKEEFDELKKAYSEYKKWADKTSKDNATEKMKSIVDFSQFTKYGIKAEDIFDLQSYRDAVQKMYDKIKGSLNSTDRRKFGTTFKVALDDIDVQIEESKIKKATEKVQQEINNAMKQYDLWKTWFNATGDNDLAMKMSVSVTPVFDERTASLQDSLKNMLSKYSVDMATFLADAWGKAVQQEGEGGMKEKFLNIDATEGAAMYELYKKIYDLAWQTGEDLSKGAADAVKSMLTYEEQVAKTEKERQDALKGANGNTLLENQINAKYDAQIAEIDPAYKQFMSAVTTMTIEAAEEMGLAIKNRLLNELQTGAKSQEEYAKAVENVDKQIETSRNRITSWGDAWLKDAIPAYRKQTVTEANYYATAAIEKQNSALKKLTKAYDKQSKAKGIGENVINTAEITNAVSEYDNASQDVIDALQKLADAFNKQNKTTQDGIDYGKFGKVFGKVQNVTNALSAFGEAIGQFAGNDSTLNGLKNTIQGISTVVSSVSSWMSLGKSLGGDKAGAAGAMVGAFFGIGDALYNAIFIQGTKDYIRPFNELTEKMGELNQTLSNLESRGLSSVFNFEMDSSTRTQLENLASGDSIVGGGKVATYAQKALQDNSYYYAQMATLQAQYDALDAEYREMRSNNDKGDWDEQIQDTKESMADLKEDMKYFAEDMMKDIYSIDFKSWAQELSDTLVEAWINGEDAADAYADKVNELMKSVTKSVIQQNIIEAALKPILTEFESKFVDASGKMDYTQIDWLSNQLNAIFPNISTAVTQFLENMKASGTDLSDTSDSASTSSSIQSVTEETADVLAALVEGMRLDLSIQRTAVEQIRDAIGAGENTRSLNAIAEAQVLQLQQIATNTYNTHQELVNLNSKFDEVTAGTKSLSIQ